MKIFPFENISIDRSSLRSILRKMRSPSGMSEGVVVYSYLVLRIKRRLKEFISNREMVGCRKLEGGKSIIWLKFKK